MACCRPLKQPWLGIAATFVCVISALLICSLFNADTFGTWVTLILVGTVPAQIILSLVWENSFPGFVANLCQPSKGFVLLGMMSLASLMATPTTLWLVGGGVAPPLPYPVMFSILSVVINIWLVTVLHSWPLTALSSKPVVIGIGVWLLTYVLAYLIFITFFNFQFLQGTALYIVALDPLGIFNAWTALSFAISTLLIMDCLILLDYWPIQRITAHAKTISKQPYLGLITTGIVLITAYLVWYFFVVLLGMGAITFMVKVAVPTIFGAFIMLLMLQSSPVAALQQPLKGTLLLLFSIVLAVLMYGLYRWASSFVVGALEAGKPTYQLELWLASAMLAVTFPLLVVFSEFLGFWPLLRKQQKNN